MPTTYDLPEPALAWLARLEAFDGWFAHVGEPFAWPGRKVRCVPDWATAAADMNDNKWVNYCIGVNNAIRQTAVAVHGMPWFTKHWNPMARADDARCKEVVERALAALRQRHTPDIHMTRQVGYDLSGPIAESRYLPHGVTPFYTEIIEVYLAGHFPCGLTGRDHRTGTLHVF